MANDRFQELLRQMPSIANAVNGFESESIQQMAYKELLAALSSTVEVTGNDAPPAAPAKPAAAKAAASGKPGLSTAEILAKARGEASQPGPNGQGEKTEPATKPEPPAIGGVPLGDPHKPSEVELIKEASHQLRGEIPEELVDGNDFFGKGSVQLLKHHGTYQQDNRDARARGGGAKSKRDYMFMVRSKIPGGKLTSDQLLAQLDLADDVGNSTLRVTSRQGLQLHGVVKSDLKKTIEQINHIQMSTLGACGDVNRNVMCCPAPHRDDAIHDELQALADQLAAHFAPRTTAYHELWLRDLKTGEDELVGGGKNGHEIEPIYGKHYLPRKFKMAIGLPEDNCVDLYTHDLALMAICKDGQITGYNMLVGGGQGVTPSAAKTFPALGKKLAFVTPDQAVDLATAVVKVQRDFGNRTDRKNARLKYLIHDWGLERFKAKVEEYYGNKLREPDPIDVSGFDDHMGWHKQGDGKWFYGLNVENGRIKDDDSCRLKSALREICSRLTPGIRLTSHQDILFTDVAAKSKSILEGILREHHVALSEEVSTVRRWSMACVAWPTCGLSITEAERALPGIMDQMESELAKLGLASEAFTVRMTGCPNGCARPYNSDIGLVGKTAGKYTVSVGGRLLGNRLNFIYKDLVPESEVVPTLTPLFVYFKQERTNGESFGDFCARKGQEDLLAWSESYQATA
ncbi:MAG TPA: NADPH-dependent assimilatory sulfite reductase hemoprotein subunit [Pirellulaceae bacterium]|nr:NADPH-dependent assimilatory sulfite reductase hemoprotein subunit [Pirellulaceae bacterium]